MSVGYTVDKTVLDGVAGSTVQALRDTFDQVDRVKAWLDARTDSEIVALGYSSGEVATLKSAFTQLAALRAVMVGQQAVAAPNDFLFFGRKLLGLR